jgi:hypothetical protein
MFCRSARFLALARQRGGSHAAPRLTTTNTVHARNGALRRLLTTGTKRSVVGGSRARRLPTSFSRRTCLSPCAHSTYLALGHRKHTFHGGAGGAGGVWGRAPVKCAQHSRPRQESAHRLRDGRCCTIAQPRRRRDLDCRRRPPPAADTNVALLVLFVTAQHEHTHTTQHTHTHIPHTVFCRATRLPWQRTLTSFPVFSSSQ